MKRSDGERPGAGDPWLDRRGDRVGVRTRGGAGPSPTPPVALVALGCWASGVGVVVPLRGGLWARVGGGGAPPNELILLFWCSCGYCAGAVFAAAHASRADAHAANGAVSSRKSAARNLAFVSYSAAQRQRCACGVAAAPSLEGLSGFPTVRRVGSPARAVAVCC